MIQVSYAMKYEFLNEWLAVVIEQFDIVYVSLSCTPTRLSSMNHPCKETQSEHTRTLDSHVCAAISRTYIYEFALALSECSIMLCTVFSTCSPVNIEAGNVVQY